jgi:hypothetical protein
MQFVRVNKRHLRLGSIVRDLGLLYSRKYDPAFAAKHKHQFLSLEECIRLGCGSKRIQIPKDRRVGLYHSPEDLQRYEVLHFPHKNKLFQIIDIGVTYANDYGLSNQIHGEEWVRGREVNQDTLRPLSCCGEPAVIIEREWRPCFVTVNRYGSLVYHYGFPPFDLLRT